MTEAYKKALDAHSAALRAFDLVRNEYRAGTVSDDAFIAAVKIMKAADAAFDVAYAEEERSAQ